MNLHWDVIRFRHWHRWAQLFDLLNSPEEDWSPALQKTHTALCVPKSGTSMVLYLGAYRNLCRFENMDPW